jgi:pimeloyl-ACP methyl ester carboxylesterase
LNRHIKRPKEVTPSMQHKLIGPPNKKIFVSIIPPKRNNLNEAVLLCYPFGQEYMRAHKAFRQLANLLSRKGYTVMKFDYPGTGDSYEDGKNIGYNDWLEGAHSVLDFFKSETKHDKIHVLGLRLGALVAAELATKNAYIQKLVLWDPFANGASYIQDCTTQLSDPLLVPNNVWNIHGYPLPKIFREQVLSSNIEKMTFPETVNLIQILSHENNDSKMIQKVHDKQVTQKVTGPTSDWNYVDMVGSILMPTTLIQSIVSTLTND